jgi:hypothetical protein
MSSTPLRLTVKLRRRQVEIGSKNTSTSLSVTLVLQWRCYILINSLSIKYDVILSGVEGSLFQK